MHELVVSTSSLDISVHKHGPGDIIARAYTTYMELTSQAAVANRCQGSCMDTFSVLTTRYGAVWSASLPKSSCGNLAFKMSMTA